MCISNHMDLRPAIYMKDSHLQPHLRIDANLFHLTLAKGYHYFAQMSSE